MGRVFALTGGIGSGKSTVAAIWREAGLAIIDADEVARFVVEAGKPALTEIVEAFGGGVLRPEGALDRKALARIVFNDPSRRETLNGIVHPRIRQEVAERISALREKGEQLICYEIPLLFETGQEDNYRPVVVVTVSPEVQLRRAMARDGADEGAIRARIAAQIPLEEKASRADHLIVNDADQQALRVRALNVLEEIRAGA